MSVASFWDDELLRLKEVGLERRVRSRDPKLIDLASNDYLGLSRHPALRSAVQHAAIEIGVGSAASRLLGGHTAIHETLQLDLAAWLGREAALVFPAGYMANVGVLSALAGPGDAIILDRLCHASLIDGARLSGARVFVFRHADPEHAEAVLKRTRSYRRRILVTDSVFSMDGDVAPLSALGGLCERYDALGMLDEAHALGVFGVEGCGLCETAELKRQWPILVGTFSKSFGTQGGFVSGSASLCQWLTNRSRAFIYTTGSSPLTVAAAQAALPLIKKADTERALIQTIAGQLRKGLKELGFHTLGSTTQIVPVMVGASERTMALSREMEEAGFFVPPVRPPTVPDGTARLRISLNTTLSSSVIDRLLVAFSQVLKRP